MTKIYRSLTDLIGNTPLLELTNYNRKFAPQATIIAKLEYFNPAGSAKDRIAMAMIDAAEARRMIRRVQALLAEGESLLAGLQANVERGR